MAFENNRISHFEGLVTLILTSALLIDLYLHAKCNWNRHMHYVRRYAQTDKWTDRHLRPKNGPKNDLLDHPFFIHSPSDF